MPLSPNPEFKEPTGYGCSVGLASGQTKKSGQVVCKRVGTIQFSDGEFILEISDCVHYLKRLVT